MKKFLTVLLALSVVFTYTVGTAFASEVRAAVSYDDAKLIQAAADYANGQIAKNAEEAYKDLAKATPDAYITEEAYKVMADEVAIVYFTDIVDAWETKYLNGEALPAGWKATSAKIDTVAEALYGNYVEDATYAGFYGRFADPTYKWTIQAAKEQFKLNYPEIVGLYDKVDVDTLYSKNSPADGESYYEQAVKAIENSKEVLNKTFFDADGNVIGINATNVADVEDVETWLTNSVILGGDWKADGVAKLGCEKYAGTEVVKYYYLDDAKIPTKDDETAGDAADAATTAALKAKIAANVAAYLADKDEKAPTGYTKKEAAEMYTNVYNFLAEQIPNVKELADNINAFGPEAYSDAQWTGIDKAIADIEALEAFAAKYAAEKDATGAFVRDAKKVAEIVEAATLDRYAALDGYVFANDTNAYDTARTDIKNMTTIGDAAKLAFDKEAKKVALDKQLEKKLAEVEYYDLEEAQLKAAFEEAKAKVDANKDNNFVTIDTALTKAIATSKIPTAELVDGLFTANTDMGKELDKQKDALIALINYKNSATKPYEEGYVNGAAKARDLVMAYYINNDARTLEEMKTLSGVVEAVAATLPTTGELAAAKKAAEDAIKALPALSKITSADKDTFQNAYDLKEVYNDMADTVGTTDKITNFPTDKVGKLAAKIMDDIKLAYAKADKKDKEALKAIAAEVKALNEEELFDGIYTFVNLAKDDLKAIQTSEYNAVVAALRALPLNITLADKAQVEAARTLYDAYVAEYTDYEDATNGYVADDFGKLYHDLALAEAELAILQAKADIKAVESLKIKASSSAVKGKITVKWSVTGDVPAGTVYKVYKSTKAQSGYAYMGKTTKNYMANKKNLKKGKRYFYKVKAVLVVDGVTYTSDWSNKANRFAK